jgi:hypothetical protein
MGFLLNVFWQSFCHHLMYVKFYCISEPFVTEEELKLMLRGAELSGAIEEEEQVIEQDYVECICYF